MILSLNNPVRYSLTLKQINGSGVVVTVGVTVFVGVFVGVTVFVGVCVGVSVGV